MNAECAQEIVFRLVCNHLTKAQLLEQLGPSYGEEEVLDTLASLQDAEEVHWDWKWDNYGASCGGTATVMWDFRDGSGPHPARRHDRETTREQRRRVIALREKRFGHRWLPEERGRLAKEAAAHRCTCSRCRSGRARYRVVFEDMEACQRAEV